MVDVLIIGAGISGCVCAERLASAGHSVTLVDRHSYLGGLASDVYDAFGIHVHRHGPHIFHTDKPAVYDYLSRFTDWRPYEHRVLVRLHDGRHVPVPINHTTLEAFDGDASAAYEAIIRPYTRKQWGMEPEALASDVLARVTVRESRDDRYFGDEQYQVMPSPSYSAMFARMVAHPHIKVLLGASIDALSESEGLHNGCVIWTGRLDDLGGYRFGALPYRSARFHRETLAQKRYQCAAVVNHPAAPGYTRITEYTHLTGQNAAVTSIDVEYPFGAGGDPYWPVPTTAARERASQYMDYVREELPRAHPLGRIGRYRYLDMDDCVQEALDLAESLA